MTALDEDDRPFGEDAADQKVAAGNSKPRSNRPYVRLFIDLVDSPAWRTPADEAPRLLRRLELEHMKHGGAENGTSSAAMRTLRNGAYGVPLFLHPFANA